MAISEIQLVYSEKSIEDLLEKNCEHYLGLKFVCRQFSTPAGIIDVIARDIVNKSTYYVIEIKKGELDADAYLQAVRYTKYLNSEMSKDGKRLFIPVIIGAGLKYELTKICESFSPPNGIFSFGKVFYRLIVFDPLKGVSFSYSSTTQKDYEDSLELQFNHLEKLDNEREYAEYKLFCALEEETTETSSLTLVK